MLARHAAITQTIHVPGVARLIATMALVLTISACHRIQPIYEVQNHPIPSASRNLTSAQITEVIIQTAQAEGWLVDRIGPTDVRATEKWKNHSAVALISHDDTTFSIRIEQSTNLLQADGHIHVSYNKRVKKLEAAIERRLYRNP
jgi:hypothetical protein